MLRPLRVRGILNDYVICATGLFVEEKDKLRSLVTTLCGKYQDDFTEATTHLIGNAAGSAKYRAAKQWGIPVVTLEWVVQCQAQNRFVSEEEYAIPPFSQLIISSTGLDQGI